MLKASVASRTLDNITGVLISFKNFRKTLKNEGNQERSPGMLKSSDAYRQNHLSNVLSLPNGDLNCEDIDKPENMSRSEISVDNSHPLYKTPVSQFNS